MIRRFIYLSLIIAAALSASAEMAAGEPRMQSAGASVQLPGLRSFAQNAPYNALIPGISGKKCISGCGSVALAEILSFYRYPEQAEGTGRLFIQDRDSTLALGGGDHSFLCDGYLGDLLHFIWGWNGYCDGYRISRDMGAGASACRGRHQEGSGLCPGLPQAYFFESCSLISTCRIFPLMVLGRASANSITRGYL